MSKNKTSYLEILKQFQGGDVNIAGIEEHKRIFKFSSLEAAAKDLYLLALNTTSWGLTHAKKLGLPLTEK